MPQKSEFVCRKSRFVHHILCGNPFISRDFYAIRPLILWHILGAYFLLIWGVGVVKIIFTLHHGRCQDSYYDGLKSELADTYNFSPGRWGGAITAALFLKKFIKNDRPWIHLDIAGPVTAFAPHLRSHKYYQYSTEGQKRHQN